MPDVFKCGGIDSCRRGDQEVIEEFERIANDGGSEDLDLVRGQAGASIEYLEHRDCPMALLTFGSDVRASSPPMTAGQPLNSARGSLRTANHRKLSVLMKTRAWGSPALAENVVYEV